MEFDHPGDRDYDLEEECEVSRLIIGTFAEVLNAICLEDLSLLLH